MRNVSSVISLAALLSIATACAACSVTTAPAEAAGAASAEPGAASAEPGAASAEPGAASAEDPASAPAPAATCTGTGPLLVMPVRVHILSSSVDGLNATLAASEVAPLFEEVNTIWSQACIRFTVEGAVAETVSAEDGAIFEAAVATGSMTEVAAALAAVVPKQAMLTRGVDVYVIKSFGIKALGRYFAPIDSVVWADTRYDGPRTNATIMAHELGHAMSLQHYEGADVETNVMQPGGMDPSRARNLTADQIASARAQAATGDAR